jgi:hypothetical protein
MGATYKVVFLDIDGVLNNAEFDRTSEGWSPNAMDPRSIGVLNAIIRRSAAWIVISSSWRKLHSLSEIRRVLYEAGLIGEIIDTIPCLYGYLADEVAPRPMTRGDEIQEWINLQEEKPTSFVIIEDEEPMAHLEPHTVRIDGKVGLLLEHLDKALALLNDGERTGCGTRPAR